MRLPSAGIHFETLVGSYRIIKKENTIQAKEAYSPYIKTSYRLVDMASESSGQAYLDAINLPLYDNKRILSFCNKYGLFNSGINSFEPHRNNYLGTDKNLHELPPTCTMQESLLLKDFYQNIILIKAMYNIWINLKEKTNGSTPHLLLSNLLTLIANKYSLASLKELCKDEDIELLILPNINNEKSYINTLETILGMNNSMQIISKELYSNYVKLINDLKDAKMPFQLDEYGYITVSDNFGFTAEIRDNLYKIAPMILTWRINEVLNKMPPQLLVDDTGNLCVNWKVGSLYEYLILELALDFSPDKIYAICQNLGCGNVFKPTNHADAKYCCKQCMFSADKRYQRQMDRKDPYRPRKSPKFQSKNSK